MPQDAVWVSIALFPGQMPLWQVATEAGAGTSLLVLSHEHAGLGSFSLFFSSSSELSALRMSNNFSFTVASPYHLTLPARSLHLHSEKGMELTIVPAFWTVSEVSYPSKETVPWPLSSTPSAVPSRLRYIPALPPPHLQPWHRGPVLLMSKGIAYI